ncbi:MAG: hypothetical protein V4699_00980 [Patescibacteria group bacterium]
MEQYPYNNSQPASPQPEVSSVNLGGNHIHVCRAVFVVIGIIIISSLLWWFISSGPKTNNNNLTAEQQKEAMLQKISEGTVPTSDAQKAILLKNLSKSSAQSGATTSEEQKELLLKKLNQ